jgi:hypothetical protein
VSEERKRGKREEGREEKGKGIGEREREGKKAEEGREDGRGKREGTDRIDVVNCIFHLMTQKLKNGLPSSVKDSHCSLLKMLLFVKWVLEKGVP